jgi:hypothetical protein
MSGSSDLVCAASKNSKGEVVRKLQATGSNSLSEYDTTTLLLAIMTDLYVSNLITISRLKMKQMPQF